MEASKLFSAVPMEMSTGRSSSLAWPQEPHSVGLGTEEEEVRT